MSDEIIGLQSWFATPAGRYLLAWEQARFDEAVADIFGYHALQLGLPVLDGLATNRMAHRWLAVDGERWEPAGGMASPTASATAAAPPTAPAMKAGVPEPLPPFIASPTSPSACHSTAALPQALQPVALRTDFHALPFAAQSLDLVVLPHTLELSADPHATLREAERVLMPEGRVVICGLNPVSLWGLKQRRALLAARFGIGRRHMPDAFDFIGYLRLRDWLRLLSFEVDAVQFGCWRPAMRSQTWLDRHDWMDRAGPRWWPIFGAAYFVVATKRVPGMRKLEAGWKKRAPARASAAPVSVAGSARR